MKVTLARLRVTSLAAVAVAATTLFSLASAAGEPAHFVYTTASDFERVEPILRRPDIAGAEVIYVWRELEGGPGEYDFSAIHTHLAATEALGKALVIQIQDRFFSPEARRLPDYLLQEPVYGGGLAPQVDDAEAENPQVVGWVAMHWNGAVRSRYQALLAALADDLDGRVLAVVLPETAVELDRRSDTTGFDCDAYFDAEMENFAFATRAFERSQVILFANFWPCEWNNSREYMARAFEAAVANGGGMGGPDIVPWRAGQMANSYPFLNRYRDRLAFIGMSVQEPTLEYVDPETGSPFTREQFVTFASDYLGVDAIFWSVEAPWLGAP